MNKLEIIHKTITDFCIDFVNNPYLCYTEHGQHALFYTKLYTAFPETELYDMWQQQKVCLLQKEYPTAGKLGKPQRQHWDVSVLSQPLSANTVHIHSYDYFELLAAIEFGLNEPKEHLKEDMRRLDHPDSNVANGIIVHLYRLSESGLKFSGRDWTSRSKRIVTLQEVIALTVNSSCEVYYSLFESTNPQKNGVWHIIRGKAKKLY